MRYDNQFILYELWYLNSHAVGGGDVLHDFSKLWYDVLNLPNLFFRL